MIRGNSLHLGFAVSVFQLLGSHIVMVFPSRHKVLKECVVGDLDCGARRECLVVGNRFFHVFRLGSGLL